VNHAHADVEVENQSAMYAQLALQGPAADAILQPLTSHSLAALNSFQFQFADVAAIRCMVARTGYTGERGFELYCHVDAAERLWQALMDGGQSQGLVAVGLAARDTLRLEKAYPLYGHELDESTTPLEAGLEWVLKFTKPAFLGRERLLEQKRQGVTRKLVGLEALEPGIPRGGYGVFKNGDTIGTITSGTKSPSLGKAIALAYIACAETSIDNRLEVEIRGRKIPVKTVLLPFYRH
jgi:aminomethyltransferase